MKNVNNMKQMDETTDAMSRVNDIQYWISIAEQKLSEDDMPGTDEAIAIANHILDNQVNLSINETTIE